LGYAGERKKGDWYCPGCGALVFASKTECFKCGCSKDGHAATTGSDLHEQSWVQAAYSQGPKKSRKKRGDWSCPECNANVFASKTACYKCGCPKTDDGTVLTPDPDRLKSEEIAVFVKNLPEFFDWATLKDLFEGYGVVHSNVSYNREGVHNGFGVVKFATMEDAQLAVDSVNGFEPLDGCKPLNVYIDNKISSRPPSKYGQWE
jgi:hypothetical protein